MHYRGQTFATVTRAIRMHRVRMAGLGVTVLALVAYAVGTAVPYPGRAFSLTVGMLGIALAALGRAES